MARLKPSEWKKVEDSLTPSRLRRYGFPARRRKSVVIGTLNIRDLGSDKNRSGRKKKGRTPGAWRLLARICASYDLLAVQEVLDDLSGIRRIQEEAHTSFGREFKLLVSDIAGKRPGGAGEAERLAFLYDPRRIAHTELAAEVTQDRSTVINTLITHRTSYTRTLNKYAKTLRDWELKNKRRVAAGKRKSSKPWLGLPSYLTFIRPPHVGSFSIIARADAKPIEFLAVNAHLLYGKNSDERFWEFLELVEWLTLRAKSDNLYAPNLILLGDCNLETNKLKRALKAQQADTGTIPATAMTSPRDFLRWKITSLNSTRLRGKSSAEVNFPLLDMHPNQGLIRTNARQKESYDQIGIFFRDPRLPEHNKNSQVTGEKDTYNYGVLRVTDLLAEILEEDAWSAANTAAEINAAPDSPPGSPFPHLSKRAASRIISAVEYDVTDHLPTWIRVPIPGA